MLRRGDWLGGQVQVQQGVVPQPIIGSKALSHSPWEQQQHLAAMQHHSSAQARCKSPGMYVQPQADICDMPVPMDGRASLPAQYHAFQQHRGVSPSTLEQYVEAHLNKRMRATAGANRQVMHASPSAAQHVQQSPRTPAALPGMQLPLNPWNAGARILSPTHDNSISGVNLPVRHAPPTPFSVSASPALLNGPGSKAVRQCGCAMDGGCMRCMPAQRAAAAAGPQGSATSSRAASSHLTGFHGQAPTPYQHQQMPEAGPSGNVRDIRDIRVMDALQQLVQLRRQKQLQSQMGSPQTPSVYRVPQAHNLTALQQLQLRRQQQQQQQQQLLHHLTMKQLAAEREPQWRMPSGPSQAQLQPPPSVQQPVTRLRSPWEVQQAKTKYLSELLHQQRLQLQASGLMPAAPSPRQAPPQVQASDQGQQQSLQRADSRKRKASEALHVSGPPSPWLAHVLERGAHTPAAADSSAADHDVEEELLIQLSGALGSAAAAAAAAAAPRQYVATDLVGAEYLSTSAGNTPPVLVDGVDGSGTSPLATSDSSSSAAAVPESCSPGLLGTCDLELGDGLPSQLMRTSSTDLMGDGWWQGLLSGEFDDML